MKRILSFFTAAVLVLSMCISAFAADKPSATQITGQGGENTEKWSTDKVKVSKTIEGTDIENVFDITLNVQTQTNIETVYQDPDVAIVLVMDISNTMLEDYGSNKTKYQAAVESAEVFVDQFAVYTDGDRSRLGFVAFNTDGHQICEMQRCDTTERAITFKSTLRTETGAIVTKYANQSNYNETYHTQKRYTNVEAGLKMANDMLAACSNSNKFVIFLSDGLPTTYCNTTSQTDGNYNGYTPLSSSGTQDTNGVFRDKISGKYVLYGGNYSDKGAVRAREMATTLKNNGVTVFTIGAGLNTFRGTDATGLSGEALIQNQMKRAFGIVGSDGVATIDNNFAKLTSYNETTINNYNWEIGNFKNGVLGQYAPLGTGNLFENWLRYGIGSNQYYDTSNTNALKEAFDEIFIELQRTVQENASMAWVVTDPMGTNLEFIGFFDKSGNLSSGNLTGAMGEGTENTATYLANGEKFEWQLQKSGYTKGTVDSTTTYTYTLKYRVRLTNEVTSGFVENTSYNTNGTTTLTYQTLNNTVLSDMKTINFPIPSVKGYLGELEFQKVDQYDRLIAGAEFKLVHDTTNCAVCKGNGTSVANTGYLADKTGTSEGGTVTFENIPSGHKYTLQETSAPAGYSVDSTIYHVTVAYDVVTTDITDSKIVNQMDEYQIIIKKIDGTKQEEVILAGATFEVYFDEAFTQPATHPDGTAIGTLTTGADGIVNMGILDFNKSYYLKEIKAPEGYLPLTEPVKITIAPGSVTASSGTTELGVEKQEDQSLVYIVKVTNNPGVKLPATGGSGTQLYTLCGMALIMASALMYGFRMRRRERRLK